MLAIALTLVLVSGFVLASTWRVTNVLRLKEGQVIYFVAVVAALPPYLVASGLYVLIDQADLAQMIFAGVIERVSADTGDLANGDQLRLFQVAVLAIPVALGLGVLLNLPLNSNDALTRYLFERFGDGEPLDSIFSEAASRQLPVLVSLNTSKFYLGYPLQTELYGSSNAQWIHLAPWLSGYRDEKQRLQFTTAYAPIAWSGSDGPGRHDPRFQVAIPLSSVASAAPFDLSVYHRHFLAGEAADTAAPDMAPEVDGRWRTSAGTDLATYFCACLALLSAVLALGVSALAAAALGLVGFVLMYIVATPPSVNQPDPVVPMDRGRR